MRPAVVELWAAEIRRDRHRFVVEATTAAVDADFPADVVRGLAFQAGQQWDTLHPLLASRIQEEA